MESLISYESDDENKEHSIDAISTKPVISIGNADELDDNYDLVEMDESDENSSCKDEPVIFTTDTTVSPEDAPLVFRPVQPPGNSVRCISLDSRNSSDMEMDDDDNDVESEIQIESSPLDDEPKEIDEKLITERGPQTNKEDEFSDTSSDDVQDIEKDVSKPITTSITDFEIKNQSHYCKRPHSPTTASKKINLASEYERELSRSPERPWKNPRLQKKASALSKMGIDISGAEKKHKEQLMVQLKEVKDKTGISLPSYYNPAVINPMKYAQQIQKRQLIWGKKSNDTKANETKPAQPNAWSSTTFKNDSDGKMTEKFKRLMGIKVEPAVTSEKCEKNEVITKQEEMFSNMEAQYQIARMVTHTHRGVGLGYGSRSSIHKNS